MQVDTQQVVSDSLVEKLADTIAQDAYVPRRNVDKTKPEPG